MTPTAPKGNSWLPTPRGVGLATKIELFRRRPSTKGWIFYGITLAVVVVIAVLVAVIAGDNKTDIPMELNVLMVLGLGILISTSLAATSINGDSSEGVLAPLQMTRLTAGDIAFGKLIASWAVSVVALVTVSPFLIYAFTKSTWKVSELLVVLGAILFVVLAATAIGLAWSSINARAIASVAMAHMTLGFFMIGTLVLFGVMLPLVTEKVPVVDRYYDYSSVSEEQWSDPNFDETTLPCVEDAYDRSVTHQDRLSWLVLVNPFVAVAETAPLADPKRIEQFGGGDGVFSTIHMMVASAQIPTDVSTIKGYDGCAVQQDEFSRDDWVSGQVEQSQFDRQPWVGLGMFGILLVASMVLVIARLRVPYKKLRGGTRVA